MKKSFRPPSRVAQAAKTALKQRAAKPPSQRGGTAVGLARARQLSNRQPVSLETVRRMDSYFARHSVDKQGKTWGSWGKGQQAWGLWGGDAGRSWARSVRQRHDPKK